MRNELSLYSMGLGHSRPFAMGVVELKSFCSEKIFVEGAQPCWKGATFNTRSLRTETFGYTQLTISSHLRSCFQNPSLAIGFISQLWRGAPFATAQNPSVGSTTFTAFRGTDMLRPAKLVDSRLSRPEQGGS